MIDESKTALPPTPTTGFISSEIAVLVATFAADTQVPPQLVPYVTALAGVYIIGRVVLKVAHALGYLKQVPDLPDIPTIKSSTTLEVDKK